MIDLNQRITRRRLLLVFAAVGTSTFAGVSSAWMTNRSSHGQQTRFAVQGMYQDYESAQALIDSSELIVLGKLKDLQRVNETRIGPNGEKAKVAHERFLVEIREVLKGSQYAAPGEILSATLGTKSAWFTDAVPEGFVLTEHGEIDLPIDAEIVGFFRRGTNEDGTRPWSPVGEPSMARIGPGGRLVFATTLRFRESLAEAGIRPAVGAGDAPFLATLDVLRNLASKSLDPSVVDPPRDTVPNPFPVRTPSKPKP